MSILFPRSFATWNQLQLQCLAHTQPHNSSLRTSCISIHCLLLHHQVRSDEDWLFVLFTAIRKIIMFWLWNCSLIFDDRNFICVKMADHIKTRSSVGQLEDEEAVLGWCIKEHAVHRMCGAHTHNHKIHMNHSESTLQSNIQNGIISRVKDTRQEWITEQLKPCCTAEMATRVE